jgi:hypothetical protein
MIVAAAEIPPSVSIKQSFRIGEVKSNTFIAIHTYKTFIHVLTCTYNCCERKRRKEKENINCLGAAICPSLTSELTEFSSSTNCPIVQDKISSSENPDNNNLPFRKTIHTGCC